MCTTKTFLLFVLALSVCFREIQCKRSTRSRGSRSRHGAQDLNVQYAPAGRSGQQQPDGENPTKIGSAPTALDSRFNSSPKDQLPDQVNKQAVDPLLSPNPQKPSGWNLGGVEVTQKNDSKGKDLEKIDLRNYPNAAYPNTGSYNYYGIGDSYNYGNGYQSDPSQPFPGYRTTSNIGVVPPKGVSIADYYGNMLGYPQLQPPNNAGLFTRLFKGHNHGFGNNAYKNVLAGLLIWNLMHGMTNYRYNVYNHYNQPQMIPKNMSLGADDVVVCAQNVTMLCETANSALCTINGTIICISLPPESCTDTTPKSSSELACTDEKKCVTKITVVDDSERKSVFCVTTFAVPQVPDDDDCKTGNVEQCSSPKSSVDLNGPGDVVASR